MKCACGTPWHPATGHVLSRKESDLILVLCGPCARDFIEFLKREGMKARRRGKDFAAAAATSIRAP